MSLISIIFIFVVHYLISFFKNTLTVPKIRDLVNSPSQKYQNIFNTISHDMTQMGQINQNSYTSIDSLPSAISDSSSSMKNELKSFLKQQLNSSGNDVVPYI